jgi:single-stranded DNA-binding protein
MCADPEELSTVLLEVTRSIENMSMNFYGSVVGRLGKEVEKKEINGSVFYVFSLASDGAKKDETVWVDVIVGDKGPVGVLQYLKKGGIYRVDGRVEVRKREDGGYYSPRLRAYNVDIIISPRTPEGVAGAKEGVAKRAANEEDVPF